MTYEFVHRLIFYLTELTMHKSEGAEALRVAFRRLAPWVAYPHYTPFFVTNTTNHFPAACLNFCFVHESKTYDIKSISKFPYLICFAKQISLNFVSALLTLSISKDTHYHLIPSPKLNLTYDMHIFRLESNEFWPDRLLICVRWNRCSRTGGMADYYSQGTNRVGKKDEYFPLMKS